MGPLGDGAVAVTVDKEYRATGVCHIGTDSPGETLFVLQDSAGEDTAGRGRRARPHRLTSSTPVSVCTSCRCKLIPHDGQGICSFSVAGTSCALSAAHRRRRKASKQRGQNTWVHDSARIASPGPAALSQTVQANANQLPSLDAGSRSLLTSTESSLKTSRDSQRGSTMAGTICLVLSLALAEKLSARGFGLLKAGGTSSGNPLDCLRGLWAAASWPAAMHLAM